MKIDTALVLLKSLLVSPATTRDNMEKVEIVFLGYDDDPRELYEIEEVRKYVKKLNTAFPYWLFFLTKELHGLQCLLFCLVHSIKNSMGKVEMQSDEISALLRESWIPAMNRVAKIAGREKKTKAILKRAMEYFVTGPKRGSA